MSRCFICSKENPNVLETHHLIPRRYGGDDTSENTVTLCANCHAAVERLYSRRFFERLRERLRASTGANQDVREEGPSKETDTVVIDPPNEEGLLECPICGRTKNRRGVPFESPDQVRAHISGSHDDDHSAVTVETGN
jgi:hypothetical protein